MFPEPFQVISEDVLLCRCEMFAARGLKRLDLILRHINQEGKVC